jgi:hypothetical protein
MQRTKRINVIIQRVELVLYMRKKYYEKGKICRYTNSPEDTCMMRKVSQYNNWLCI